MRTTLSNLRALMTSDPVVVPHDASLREADALFRTHGFRHLPVERDGEIVGILSDRDLCLSLGLRGGVMVGGDGARRPVRVEEIVRNPVRWGRSDERTVDAARRMLAARVGCLPVFEAGGIVGIVTETDLLCAFVELLRERGDDSEGVVRDLAAPGVAVLPKQTSVEHALDAMHPLLRHVLVGDGGEIDGIASERDLFRGLAREMELDEAGELAGSRELPVVTVADVMSHPVVSIGPQVGLRRAAERMLEHGFGALPVIGDADPSLLVQTHLIERFAYLL
jgi:acetoin utilization protein AcuB